MTQKLVFVGLLMVLAGFGLLAVWAASGGSSSAGGVVFIGPLPIVFGSGPSGPELALVSVAIGGVMLVALLLWRWRFFQRRGE